MASDALRPLIVFADDWGRHPSSCQHLVRQLLPERPVVWVNTIGTRPVRLDLATVHRAREKLAGWLKSSPAATPTDAGPTPTVIAPKMWPSFASAMARRLNRFQLVKALRPVVARLGNPVILTTLPVVADVLGAFPGVRVVYYCVDDFSVWPGYDGATMGRLERDMVPHVDAALAVSETLQTHLTTLGLPSTLLTHGVDVDFWRPTGEVGGVPEFAGLARPVALFWGVIDRRLDLGMLRALSAGGVTLVLVGPREDPDPELDRLPGVVLRPPAAFARLPRLAESADMLVMPYADLPVTRAMQPLKLKEYLATGKPVVVSRLPTTEPWHDALDIATTPSEFVTIVKSRAAGGMPESQKLARGRLAGEGWAAKARQLATVVDSDGSSRVRAS